MERIYIDATVQRGLKPVGSVGERTYDVLADNLRRLGFSDEHIAMFAEPVPRPDGSAVDWYAAADGPVQRWEDAPPPVRDAARQRLEALSGDIVALAKRLEQSSSERDIARARALLNALDYPGDEYLRIVESPKGPRPVVLCWSHVRDGDDPGRRAADLWVRAKSPGRATIEVGAAAAAEAAAASPPVPPPVAPAAATRQTQIVGVWRRGSPLAWLLWALLALMLGIIAYLLLMSCAVRLPGLEWLRGAGYLNYCPVAAAPSDADRDLLAELEQNRALQVEMERLQRELANRAQDCRVEAVRQEAEQRHQQELQRVQEEHRVQEEQRRAQEEQRRQAEEQTRQRDEMARRVQEAGGTQGRLTVSMTWEDKSDLDLTVLCPNGDRIFLNTSACGGRLEVDRNRNAFEAVTTPVEHIVWADTAAPGTYTVQVFGFSVRPADGRRVPFKVRITKGNETRDYSGSVGHKQVATVATIQVP